MTDQDALHLYATRRDAEAFQALVHTYQGLVYAACLRTLADRELADDAAQEVFLRLAQKAKDIHSHVGAWLHRCAVNVAQDFNRRGAARRRREKAAAVAETQAGEPQQELAELREHLDAALQRLTDDERELLIQRFFLHRPQQDLAIEQDVAVSTISRRISAAVGRLREEFDKLGAPIAPAALLPGLLEQIGAAAVPDTLTRQLVKIGLSGAGGATAVVGIAGGGLLAGATGKLVAGLAAAAGLAIALTVGIVAWAPTGPTTPTLTVTSTPAATGPQWQGQPLAESAVLSGVVRDAAGQPVPNARIDLRGPGPSRSAVTDEQGRYAFVTIDDPGAYRVSVAANGHVPITGWEDATPQTRLTADSRVSRDFVLDRAGVVAVRVVDAGGSPISDATLYLNPPTDGQHPSWVRSLRQHETDADGEALLEGVRPTTDPLLLAATHEAFAPVHAMITVPDPDEPVEVELVMPRGIDVEGVAICSDGEPAPTEWSIHVQPAWWKSHYLPFSNPIREGGRFIFKNVAPDEPYKLLLSVPTGNGGGLLSGFGQRRFAADAGPLRLELPQPSPGSRVRIAGMLGVTGDLPDDAVSIDIQSTSPGWHHTSVLVMPRNGSAQPVEFELPGLTPGKHRLTFSHPGIEPKTVETTAPIDDLIVELRWVGRPVLRGQVVDADTGEPVRSFAVRARKKRHLGEGPHYAQSDAWMQVSDPQGRFDLELISPGVYDAQVSADGYAWTWSEAVNTASPPADGLQIALTHGGALEGVVRDAAGLPLAGAQVVPLSMAAGIAGNAEHRFATDAGAVRTDAAGHFLLEHLPPGDETLRITHPDHAPLVLDAGKVVEGAKRTLDPITLSAGGAVEGTVYTAAGEPAPGAVLIIADDQNATVSVDRDDAVLARLTTDAAGRFRAEHLPERPLWLLKPDPWNAIGVVRRSFLPRPDQTVQVDVGGEAAQTGRLLLDEKPVADRRVELAADVYLSPFQAYAITDEQGRFTFRGVPAGVWRLRFRADGDSYDWADAGLIELHGGPQDLGDISLDLGRLVVRFEPADHPEVLTVSLPSTRVLLQSRTGAGEPYTFHDVPAGPLELTTYLGSGVRLLTPLKREPGQAEVTATVRLPTETGDLAGLILLGDEPVAANTSVVLKNLDGLTIHLRTDEDGRFDVQGVPAGDYVVDPDDWEAATASIRVAPDRKNEQVIRLIRRHNEHRAVVMVFDDQGLPVRQAEAELHRGAKQLDPLVEAHHVAIFAVPRGDYELHVSAPGYVTHRMPLELPTGDRTPVAVVLRAAPE